MARSKRIAVVWSNGACEPTDRLNVRRRDVPDGSADGKWGRAVLGYAVQPWNVWRFPYGVTGQPSSATRPLAKSLLLSVAAGMNATLRLSEPVEWQG
jgi:hypothetical protein